MVIIAVVLESFIVFVCGEDNRNQWIYADAIFYKYAAVTWIIFHLIIIVGLNRQWFHQSFDRAKDGLNDTSRVVKGITSIPFNRT